MSLLPAVAPVALFVYNRPEHTRRTLEALAQNELAAETALIVYSDGPKSAEEVSKVEAVREIVRQAIGFKCVQIVKRLHNFGLGRSIVDGVSEVCFKIGSVIVVEDDLVTSPFFLRYMNEALSIYENVKEVISIHGYIYPVVDPLPETFLIRGTDCWGWATWRRGWELFDADGGKLLAEIEARGLVREFDFDGTAGYSNMLRQQANGQLDSWAVRWYASAFLKDKLTLYPGRTLVQNIGWDGSGLHKGVSKRFDTTIVSKPVVLRRLEPVENEEAKRAIARFFRKANRPSLGRRLGSKIQRLWNRDAR